MKGVGENSDVSKAVNIFIRISFIAILFIWSFSIIKPMFMLTLWGIIIAVATYPFHQKLTKLLKGKDKIAAVVIILLGLGTIIIPIGLFMGSFVESIEKAAGSFSSGTISIPPIPEKVRDIPIIGGKIVDLWSLLSGDINVLFEKLAPQLQEYGATLLRVVGGLTITTIQFVLSVLIAGVFLMNADSTKVGANKIFKLLIGDFVEDFHEVAAGTIKSVVAGVVGIAVIQAVLAGIGMLLVGVPGAGVWSILIMILAIIQLPPVLILIPVAIYVYSTSSVVVGVIYVVWTIIVGSLDNVLKPIFMGRGVDIPMLVILLGSIGGMLSYGIIGLFVGPVVLALGYKFIAVLLERNGK
jgi:predicted PurR-regulated permease PerM